MKPASVFPQYSLAVWPLCAPLVVGVVDWFFSRRMQTEDAVHDAAPG
jgi:hypothetical protein